MQPKTRALCCLTLLMLATSRTCAAVTTPALAPATPEKKHEQSSSVDTAVADRSTSERMSSASESATSLLEILNMVKGRHKHGMHMAAAGSANGFRPLVNHLKMHAAQQGLLSRVTQQYQDAKQLQTDAAYGDSETSRQAILRRMHGVSLSPTLPHAPVK